MKFRCLKMRKDRVQAHHGTMAVRFNFTLYLEPRKVQESVPLAKQGPGGPIKTTNLTQ